MTERPIPTKWTVIAIRSPGDETWSDLPGAAVRSAEVEAFKTIRAVVSRIRNDGRRALLEVKAA